jgi:hypothetical protein
MSPHANCSASRADVCSIVLQNETIVKREGEKMPVSFERDIRPLFRQIDIDHMNRHGVLLDNYTYMSDPSNDHGNAQAVEHTLTSQSMPPGGPYWTDEQLTLLRQWGSDGFLP